MVRLEVAIGLNGARVSADCWAALDSTGTLGSTGTLDSTVAMTWSAVTCSPAATRSPVTEPSAGAVTVCSIFMASKTTSGCPAVT